MAFYEAPTQNLAIFDPDVFTQNDEPLTITSGSKYFLRFPNAQGEENLQAVNVNGVLTANSSTDLNGQLFVAGTSSFENPITLSSTTANNRRVSSSYYDITDINGNVNRTSEISQNSQILTLTNEATSGRTRFINSTASNVPTTTFEMDTTIADVYVPLTANSSFNVPNNDAFIRGMRIGFGGGNQPRNTMIGTNNGNANTSGNGNTFIGSNCGNQNSSGNDNVFVGCFAGTSNNIGKQNTFIGVDAGNKTTSGERNTHLGRQAGYFNTGNNNICIGDFADASGNISNSMAIGVDVKATTSNTIVLGASTQTVQIAGPVVLGSNSNLTMSSGTGVISQPTTTGDVSTKNSFKLSQFAFNSNNVNGGSTAFEFFDGVNGKGLFLMPNAGSGSLGSTSRQNDCVLSSRSTENNNAITISNWNTNMRNGLRVATTDISNCSVQLQCGQNSTNDYTEFRMAYDRSFNLTTTTFNNVINFNPATGTGLPNAISSAKRRLEGLGTLSFTDISGNNTTDGSAVSRIWTDSSLVNSLNGMYYDCGVNGGYHQFSARDASGSVSTPIYYGSNITSVSNTFIVRNSTTPSNRFDIVGDTSQNTFIRGRSTTASTEAHIHINCDSVNAGGTTTNNAVLNFTPFHINYRRPIQFNYLTTPSGFNQLGYSQGYSITSASFASSATIRNSATFSFTSAGTYLINWKPYAQMASGTATFSLFRFGIANTGTATFDTDTLTYTSYMDLKVAYPTLTVNDNLNEPTSCVYVATTSSVAYFNFLANYTGGTNINISGYYTITRIG